jgi:hypothetical protein
MAVALKEGVLKFEAPMRQQDVRKKWFFLIWGDS